MHGTGIITLHALFDRGTVKVSSSKIGGPPHFQRAGHEHLNERLANRWIGQAGQVNSALMKWPRRSPDFL